MLLNNQQTTKPRPYPEPLFPRFLRHPWRKTMPGANPTPRLNVQNNSAPGFKDQKQQLVRASKHAHQSGRRRKERQEHCSWTKRRQSRRNLSSLHRNPAKKCSGRICMSKFGKHICLSSGWRRVEIQEHCSGTKRGWSNWNPSSWRQNSAWISSRWICKLKLFNASARTKWTLKYQYFKELLIFLNFILKSLIFFILFDFSDFALQGKFLQTFNI